MIVVVDIGNTHICLGVFRKKQLVREFRIATNHRATADEMQLVVQGLMQQITLDSEWDGAVIASVVPELDSVMETALHNTTHRQVLLINHKTPLPLKNRYDPAHAVGADRLINSVAAIAEFRTPVIIVDFGTAITVDAVTRDKRYLGGAIFPGINLAMDSLARGTSLLPRVEIKPPKSALGRNTEQSLRSGILIGAAGAVEKLVAAMKKELGLTTKVIATGGFVSMIAPFCSVIQYIRPQLTLDGLRISWEYNQPRRRKSR